MLRCRLSLSGVPAATARGGGAEWAVDTSVPPALPIARITLRLTEENLLTGQRQRGRFELTGVARRHPAFGDAADTGMSWYGLAVENDGQLDDIE